MLPLLFFLCQGGCNLLSAFLCYCLESKRQTLQLKVQRMGFHSLFYKICIWNRGRDISMLEPKLFQSMTMHKPQHKYVHGQEISKYYLS